MFLKRTVNLHLAVMSGLIVFYYSCGQLKENSIQNTEKLPLVVVEADKLADDCTTLFEKLNTYNSDMIGMSCGWGGVVTENVTMMAELASYRCYNLIDSLMDSPNNSVKYLAVLALEIAIQDSLIQADSVLIERLKASKEI